MAAKSITVDREVTICSWVLDYGCYHVWKKMCSSLSVSSEWWMTVIQGISNEFLSPALLPKYQPLVTVSHLCYLLSGGKAAFDYSEPVRSPDEVSGGVDSLQKALTVLTNLAKMADRDFQENVDSVLQQLRVMCVLGKLRDKGCDQAKDLLSQFVQSGPSSDNEENKLYLVQQAINTSDLSSSDIRKLIENHSYTEFLSSFVERINPYMETFPEPLLSRWFDEYKTVADEQPKADWLPLSRLHATFAAAHKHGVQDKSCDQKFDEDVLVNESLGNQSPVPGREEEFEHKHGEQDKSFDQECDEENVLVNGSLGSQSPVPGREEEFEHKHGEQDKSFDQECDEENVLVNGSLGSQSPVPGREEEFEHKHGEQDKSFDQECDEENVLVNGSLGSQSPVPGREEEFECMKHLVDITAELRDTITDPLDELSDNSESDDGGDRPFTKRKQQLMSVGQEPDSPGIELDWQESEKDDSYDFKNLPKPLKFPRLRHRNRDSLKLVVQRLDALRKKKKPKKTPWLQHEEDNLRLGVRTFGVGNWAQILKQYKFLSCRTSVSLKDKWRNLKV